MRGYTQDKDAYLKRLRRIEGQVRGLQRMVEEDVYCIDVLTQVSAVTRALQVVALGLLEDHLGACAGEGNHTGRGYLGSRRRRDRDRHNRRDRNAGVLQTYFSTFRLFHFSTFQN